jgi:hypothetical protein
MKKLSLLLLLLCHFTFSGVAQKRAKQTPPPVWIEQDYLDLKYPEGSYLHVLDYASIKKLSDEEIVEVKKKLFKRMEEELAHQISTQVNVETTLSTKSEENYSNSSRTSNVKTNFHESLSITVNAKFKFQLKQTYPEKNKLWAVMVINKKECSLPLVIEALDILETTIEQVVVAIDSRSSKYLLDFEKNITLASQLQSTAIWLDSEIDLKDYRTLKNNLAGLIQEVRQLESEQKLDFAIAEVDELIYNHEYDNAIDKARRLTYQFKGRVEIEELLTRVNDQYRQHIQLQLQIAKDDLKSSISLVEDYLFFYPNDILMLSTKSTLESKLFNTIADKAELAIEGAKLNIAKVLVNELYNIKITNLERLKDIGNSLEEPELRELIASLESYWETKDYYNGWNSIKNLLNSSTKYIKDNEVQNWRTKFARKCKRLDFRKERKTSPYIIAFSLKNELRTNEAVLSDIFVDNSQYEIQQGYFTYSTAVYLRKIEEENIVLKDGKTKDKSKASLYGIKLSYLDFSSIQRLGSYDGDLTPISDEEFGWEASFDMYYKNVWHFGLGVQHEGNSILYNDYTIDRYFSSIGIHIPFSGRRGNFALLGDIVLTKAPDNPGTFRFSAGISWNPYFIRKIGNKGVIRQKYN